MAEAIIYRSALAYIQGEIFYTLQQWAIRVANRAGITTAEIKSTLAMLRHLHSATAICKLKHWISEDREFRFYRIERAMAKNMCLDERLRCNALDDLLTFEQRASGQSRDSFLSNTLTRLEYGEHVYTLSNEHHLICCGWMIVNKAKSYMSEFKQSIPFPAGSITLYDFYLHPDFESTKLYQTIIKHLLHTAFSRQDTQYVYISVPADQHIIETMGFIYQESFFLARRVGTEKAVQKSD